MTYQDILYHKDAQILRITLNRPKVLNAISPNLIMELKDAAQRAAEDDDVKVVIVSGAGRAFSAGVDLKAARASFQSGQFAASQMNENGVRFINLIETMPKVTIAMVHGYCFTGALELMLAFDLVYCSESVKIGDTHAKWGILPKWGMTQRLGRKVGILKARELSFTAQPVSGKEAERLGLVNRAIPDERLEEEVHQVAQQILSNSQQTIAVFKGLYYQSQQTHLPEGLKIEADIDVPITDRVEFLKNFEKNK